MSSEGVPGPQLLRHSEELWGALDATMSGDEGCYHGGSKNVGETHIVVVEFDTSN
jgi:hypothetical protein